MRYDTSIFVDGREISLAQPAYFIADIAANHDGDLSRAKDLIWLAKEARADCAKFQHFLAKDIVSDPGFKSLGGEQSHQSTWKKSVFEIYEQYQCPRSWTDELVRTCREAAIDFMTTPYDFEAIDTFAELVPAFKIGSGDITWTESVRRIAEKGKPVLLACGASNMADVERAVETILAVNPRLALMQCNTNYTGDLENFKNINLNVLGTFAKRWPGMILGLSDHTTGNATVLGAIAMGARVIEKHFTDDKNREGPDHHFAMNPPAWREMIDRSRELEFALGDGVKRVEANEQETVVIQRRSLRARRALKAGTVLKSAHLEALRPCPADAIHPHEIDRLLGRTLKEPKEAGDHLTWADLG